MRKSPAAMLVNHDFTDVGNSFQGISRIGRIVEMKAWVWLAEHCNLDVFPNGFGTGLIDVVTVNRTTGQILLWEIRKVQVRNKQHHCVNLTAEQMKLGINLLAYFADRDEFLMLTSQECAASTNKTIIRFPLRSVAQAA